jgi:hypothetical protein
MYIARYKMMPEYNLPAVIGMSARVSVGTYTTIVEYVKHALKDIVQNGYLLDVGKFPAFFFPLSDQLLGLGVC